MNNYNRLAVIGDVGGHRDELFGELLRLGIDPATLELPRGLVVVQVGDLIHRGPDSPGVVRLVDSVMRTNAGRDDARWVQLCGNHEQLYVADAVFHWSEDIDDVTKATLARWWDEGSMQLAWACDTQGVEVRRRGGGKERIGAGGLLITHAGLTHGAWCELGEPTTSHAAADAINEERHNLASVVWAAGRMLEPWVYHGAGVVWAEAGAEVLGSWQATADQLFFSQAHGHSSPFAYRNSQWRSESVKRACDEAHVDATLRHTRCEVNGQVIWGCDPQHGREPVARWQALELELLL